VSEQRDEIVRRMWLEENAKAKTIAMALNLAGISASRNSVIGLVHRRGWKRQGVSRAKVKREPRRKIKINPFNPPWGVPAIEVAPVVDVDVPISDYAGPMNELGQFQCRWVDKEIEPAHDMICCGRPFDEGSGVWLCDIHKAIALVKVRPFGARYRPDRGDS
jgi:hypothetical protein